MLGPWSRLGPRPGVARLALLLEDSAVSVEAIDEELAKAAGELCGLRGTSDVVDASVVLTAAATTAPS